jgi:DNA repair ATPase RecN
MIVTHQEAAMTDSIHAWMRRLDAKFDRFDVKVDRVIDDLRDLKVRASSAEEALAGVNRRLDRMEMRLDRIERRLDLVEAPIS